MSVGQAFSVYGIKDFYSLIWRFRMKMLWKAMCAIGLFAGLVGAARAGITYSYVDTTSSTGGVTTVNVYLSEALTGIEYILYPEPTPVFWEPVSASRRPVGTRFITGGTFQFEPATERL